MGVAFGDIRVPAYMPGRNFERISRLPGFRMCVAGPAFGLSVVLPMAGGKYRSRVSALVSSQLYNVSKYAINTPYTQTL